MHGGGYLGGYSGRIDHAWGARSDLPSKSAEAADRVSEEGLCRHGRVHAGPARSLVKVFGVDHVIMGTDYPFDMLDYDPIGHVNSVASFDDKARAAICGGNAEEAVGVVVRPVHWPGHSPRRRAVQHSQCRNLYVLDHPPRAEDDVGCSVHKTASRVQKIHCRGFARSPRHRVAVAPGRTLLLFASLVACRYAPRWRARSMMR